MPLRADSRVPISASHDSAGRFATGTRVLLLNYEYPPLGGGAGVATAALAHGLVQRGAEVDVVTAQAVGALPASRGAGPTVYRVRSRRKGCHHATVADAGSYLLAALPLVRRLVGTRQYDVAHIFFSLPTGALLPLIDWRGVPVVVSLRGSDVPGYDPAQRGLQRAHRVLRPFTRWIWRRADRVVAVCESLGQLALETDPTLRFSVVRNGVDLDRFCPPDISRRRRTGPVQCVAVTRLVERKGVADLLHAFGLLERGRFRLEIVGSGALESVLRGLTTALGLEGEVHFLGALDGEKVAAACRRADLFTLAPWEEAFGNVFAEALASGLPIVGSDVGGIPELVEHGTNGLLVPARSPAALAAAISQLAGDRDRCAEMGVRNRHKAETTLSWQYATQQYLDVYQSLGAGASRGRPALTSGALR